MGTGYSSSPTDDSQVTKHTVFYVEERPFPLMICENICSAAWP